VISGNSPDQLGTWTVHYQRVDGRDPVLADQINDRLDAEANREVQQATWDGSTKQHVLAGCGGSHLFRRA
jgi:hypothetical protein